MPGTLFTDVRNMITAIAAQTQVQKSKISVVKTNTDQIKTDLLAMQNNSTWAALVTALGNWIDDPANSDDPGQAAALAMQSEIDKLQDDFVDVKQAISFWQQMMGYNRAAFESSNDIAIHAVTADNDVGTGTITAESIDSLSWTPPGGAKGSTVSIANGEFKALPDDSGTAVILVERTTASDLTGPYSVEVLDVIEE